MGITLGLYSAILIFFFVISPGYILRRFYYHGEFSKQLNAHGNHLRNITYSFFIGVCISLFVIACLNLFRETPILIEDILSKFDKNFIKKPDTKLTNNSADDLFNGLSNVIYKEYLLYICFVYVFSALTGYFLTRTVILFNLDARFKIIQYNNTWHYLFTGRIFKTGKFKKSHNNNLKIKYNYLDVLVSTESGMNKLYSGLYVDYSLSKSSPDKLEKIHLLEASRYKHVNNNTEKLPIPGTIFTVMGENIININSTYIFERIEEKIEKMFLRKKMFISIVQHITTYIFPFFVVATFFKLPLFENSLYTQVINSPLYIKIFWWLQFNMLLGLLNLFKTNDNNLKIEFIGMWKLLIKLFITFSLTSILLNL